MHYASVARLLAEAVGSVRAVDFSVPEVKAIVAPAATPKAAPWVSDGEAADWRAVKLSPAQCVRALRVLRKAAAAAEEAEGRGPAGGSALPGGGPGLVEAMQECVQSQKAALDKESKARVEELALGDYPLDGVPTEEAMIRLE
ncbi:unnamed protein product, partial [Prorocentrum cordatum]